MSEILTIGGPLLLIGIIILVILAIMHASNTIRMSSRLKPHPEWPCKDPLCTEPYCIHMREYEARKAKR